MVRRLRGIALRPVAVARLQRQAAIAGWDSAVADHVWPREGELDQNE